MAHMVETMAYAGELPWHGLGVKVDDGLGVDEMIKEAGLDWKVKKIPATAEFDGQKIYSGHDMLVRESDGQPLDMVKENWIPVQNSDAFEFFREFCDAGDMEMHTAGSLLGGKKVWVLAKLKDTFEVVSDEQKTKSPSFSRFSSSTKMYMSPFLATLIIDSIGLKFLFFIKIFSYIF